YMLIVHAKEGKDSEAWKGALETIDQLMWSIEPKATQEERRKLASSIPGILKRVRTGVTTAAIEPEASSAFFGELMKCHTDVMQGPPKVKEPTVLKMKAAVAVDATHGSGAGAATYAKKAPPPPPP